MAKKKSHFADIKKSSRLQKLHSVLLRGGIFSTARLQRETGSMAIHSDVHELRCNGIKVKCTYLYEIEGRKVYGYSLESEVAVAA